MKQIFVFIFSLMVAGCGDSNRVIQSENRQPPPPLPDSQQALFKVSRNKDLSQYGFDLNKDGLDLLGVSAKIIMDRDTGRSKGFGSSLAKYKLFSITGQPSPEGRSAKGILEISCVSSKDDDCDGVMSELARDLATGQATGKRMISLEIADESEFVEVKPRLIIDAVGQPTKIQSEQGETGIRWFLEVKIDNIRLLP